jgi:hypothetical protein
MSPVTDTEERLMMTLRYVADLPPGNVEVAPNARPRTAGLSRHALIPRRWLVSVGALVVSACLAVAGLVVAGLVGEGTSPRWELISALNPAWEAVPGTLSLQFGVSLSCTSVTTCFASGAGPDDAVYVTRNGGHRWQPVALPGQPISGVQCTSPTTCAVLTVRELPTPPKFGWIWFFSETHDGGRTWSSTRAPNALSVAILMPSLATGVPFREGTTGVSCATADSCAVFAESVRPDVSSVGLFTTDAGRIWSVAKLPRGFVPGQVQCFAGGQCVSTGLEESTGTVVGALAAKLRSTWSIAGAFSTDAGATWSAARIPRLGGAIATLSCSRASHCMAVPVPSTAPPKTSSVLVSSDGGKSWSLEAGPALPAGGAISSLSCSSSASCSAMGDNWPMVIPFGGGPTGAFAASTTGASGRWRSATLPSTVQGTEAVSCPSAGTCFALAWTTTLVLLEHRA